MTYEEEEKLKYDLSGLMGMCEMECAVKKIIDEAIRQKIAFKDVLIDPQIFVTDMEKVGVMQLGIRGWLALSFVNSVFEVTPALNRRVCNRFPFLENKNATI